MGAVHTLSSDQHFCLCRWRSVHYHRFSAPPEQNFLAFVRNTISPFSKEKPSLAESEPGTDFAWYDCLATFDTKSRQWRSLLTISVHDTIRTLRHLKVKKREISNWCLPNQEGNKNIKMHEIKIILLWSIGGFNVSDWKLTKLKLGNKL